MAVEFNASFQELLSGARVFLRNTFPRQIYCGKDLSERMGKLGRLSYFTQGSEMSKRSPKNIFFKARS